MSIRDRWLALACLAAVVLAGENALAQKPKELLWTHAFDLSCRKYGESEFTKDTQRFGVESFKDTNNGLNVFLSQAGSLAVATGGEAIKGPIKDSKGPEWLTGLDLPARRAGEKEFTKTTKVHSLEVFRDPNIDSWVYITDKGILTGTSAQGARAGGSKAPKWSHSVDLSVRKGGDKDWKNAQKYGIEVYRDQSTGNLVYVSETGSLAAVAAGTATEPVKEGKAPEWLHGLDLACRKWNEPSFSKETRRFGIEVFRDANNGNLIYLVENGNLAVARGPAASKGPTQNVKEPQWAHGLNLRCRKAGEKEFSDKTQSFGAEVFRDPNVDVTLYLLETGSIATVSTAK